MLRFVLFAFAGRALSLTFYTNSSTPNANINPSSTSGPATETTTTPAALGSFILQGLEQSSTAGTNLESLSSTYTTAETARSMQRNQTGSTTSSSSYSVVVTYEASPVVTLYSDYFTKSASGAQFASAQKCWSDIVSWSSSSVSWYNANVANRTWTLTQTGLDTTYDSTIGHITSTYYPSSVSTYKLCDGSPRANVRPYTSTITFTSTTASYVRPALDYPTWTDYGTAQPCTPSAEQCQILYDDSRAKELNQNVLEHNCGMPAHGLDYSCLFGISGAVELIYFPDDVVRSNSSLCGGVGGNGTTISAKRKGDRPTVVTTLGHTFTSGSVYMSIQSLSAYNDAFQYQVGPGFSDLILTLASSDISTQCSGNSIATSMTWTDLDWPVPASAYKCQDRCNRFVWEDHNAPECSTIWEDVNPLLVIPTQITNLDPAFSTCLLNPTGLANYWFDPPIALQGQQVAATVTQPAAAATTPAAPISTPLSPTPTNTKEAPNSSPTTARDSGGDSAATLRPTEAGPQQSISPDKTAKSTAPELSEPSEGQFSAVPSNHDEPGLAPTAGSVVASSVEAVSPLPAASASSDGISATPASPASVMPAEVDPDTKTSLRFTFDPTQSAQTDAVSTLAGQAPAVAESNGNVVFASSTFTIGQVATVGGETISVKSDGIIAGTSTIAIVASSHAADDFTLTASIVSGNTQAVVIESHTISVGGPGITISGLELTQGSSGLIVNEVSKTAQPSASVSPTASVLRANSFTITASPVSGDPNVVEVGTNILSAGGAAATISGKVITQASDGLVLLPPQKTTPSGPQPTVLQDGTFTVTASPVGGNPNVVAVDGHTLSAGGAPATVGGKIISQDSIALVMLPAQATSSRTSDQEILAAGDITYTASVVSGTANAAVISGHTIASGGSAAVIDGQTISYGSSGLVVAGPHTTAALTTLSSPQEGEGDSIVYALGSMTYTAASVSGSPGAMVVNGKTLLPGGDAVIIGGATITAASNGLEIVRSGSATPLSTVATLKALPSVVTATSSTTSAPRTYTPGVKTGSAPGATTTSSAAASVQRSDCWLLLGFAGVALLWSSGAS